MTRLLTILLGAWFGWRLGQTQAYRDAVIVMRLVADGRAEVNEDGTVSLVETFEDVQREVAHLQ